MRHAAVVANNRLAVLAGAMNASMSTHYDW
jgi:hypothetical protein